MPNRIRVLFQDYNAIEASGTIPLQEDWNLIRKEKISYLTHKEGLAAADEAFHIFNAPEEILTLEQKMILKAYSGPSLSVGDVVEVYPEQGTPKAYLCASIGWQEALIEEKKPTAAIPRATPQPLNKPAPPPKRLKEEVIKKNYRAIEAPAIKFMGRTCSIDVNIYGDGKSICLKLMDKHDHTPIATATVNIPEINNSLPKEHVLIKNYSENAPKTPDQISLIDSLERAGIGEVMSAYEISETGAEVFEMKITDPWILSQAEEKLKGIKIAKAKSLRKEKSQDDLSLPL
jgi:hypothetical protein